MLGAMDHCGVVVDPSERMRIESHVASLLPPRPLGTDGNDKYNTYRGGSIVDGHIAWWSNMRAEDAEDVAMKLELAAESC